MGFLGCVESKEMTLLSGSPLLSIFRLLGYSSISVSFVVFCKRTCPLFLFKKKQFSVFFPYFLVNSYPTPNKYKHSASPSQQISMQKLSPILEHTGKATAQDLKLVTVKQWLNRAS